MKSKKIIQYHLKNSRKLLVKLLVLAFIIHYSLFTIYCFSQGVGINTTGASANPSAILDVSSINQGMLIPRMTDAQRQTLKDPATGLMIYNITTNEINFWNGTGWQRVPGIQVSTIKGNGTGPGGGTAINSNGNAPDASAILDVSASDKGILIPRTTQGTVTPVMVLLIYNTTTEQINYYNGSSWQVTCSLLIDNNKGTGINTAPSVAINAMGAAADPSAMLDIASITQGLLIPRMTFAQRDAIKSPATGLIIYNTTSNNIDYWMGTAWYEWGYSPAPGAITGNAPVCVNETGETYSISPVAGAISYTWSVPAGASITSGQGTTSITVSFGVSGGDVCVTASNACGTSSPSCLTVAVNTIPTAPTAGINTPSQTEIVWSWSTISSASGYKWGTTTTYGSANDNGTSTSYTQTGLACETTYIAYVWAYNSCGNSSYIKLVQATLSCPSTSCSVTCGNIFVDFRDGQSYNTVLIGTQCWMAQNLNYGSQVTQATTQTTNQKWCYNDIASYCTTYGGLYQWSDVMLNAGSVDCNPCGPTTGHGGIQGMCPPCWHISSDLEWSQGEYYIEDNISPTGSTTLSTFQNNIGDRGSVASSGGVYEGPGAKMKATSGSPWADGAYSNNLSGFTALPAGASYGGIYYFGLGSRAYFWTATEGSTMAWNRWFMGGDAQSERYSTGEGNTNGFSVRCVKD